MRFNFKLIAILILSLSPALAADRVPPVVNYRGLLKSAAGSAVNGAMPMRFGMYAGGTRIWYAEYRTVAVQNGNFSVRLGSADQDGNSLNAFDGSNQSAATLPVDPALLAGADASTAVELEIEVHNGSHYELLSPRVKMSSVLFALKADTLDGYDSSQLAKLDGSGRVLAGNGTPVIDADGSWIGPTAGLVGPAGPAGAPGEVGAAGPAGPAGPTGLTGATGPAGPVGLTGPAGAQGIVGAKGDKGDTGATGATGAAGAVGATGPIGPSGPIGLTGLPGAPGAQGIQGVKGDKGDTGAAGPAGPAGATGATGATGAAGANGAIGATGATGATGAQGAKGDKGDPGTFNGSDSIATTGSITAGNGLSVSGAVSLPSSSISSGNLAGGAVTAAKQFTYVSSSGNHTAVVADCGAGYVAVGGGSNCTGLLNQNIASCHCNGPSCTSCSTGTAMQQYWLTSCAVAFSSNRSTAVCVKQ